MPVAEAPIGIGEASGLLRDLSRHDHVGLAVSGGSDSMALMLLAVTLQRSHGWPRNLSVFCIDHGLSDAAGAAARMARDAALAEGLNGHLVKWRGRKPRAGIQEAARNARRKLLLGACRNHGASALVMAHTRDDQAETVVMRLARGSGLDGLAGIPRRSTLEGVELLRPLLTVSRERLRMTLRAAGWRWSDDPANDNPDFERTRVRRLMPLLADAGVGPAALAVSASRLARARQAIDSAVDGLEQSSVRPCRGQGFQVDAAKFLSAPEEVRIRLLARLISSSGGSKTQPRLQALEALEHQLTSGEEPTRTLGNCRVALRGRTLTVVKEPPRRHQAIKSTVEGETSLRGQTT